MSKELDTPTAEAHKGNSPTPEVLSNAYLTWMEQAFNSKSNTVNMLRHVVKTTPTPLRKLRRKLRDGVPPLTEEEVELSQRGLDRSADQHEVIVSRFKVDLTRERLSCLFPCMWLNDEVINFYFKLLQERTRSIKGMPKCWFANSFFWTGLCGGSEWPYTYSYGRVRRWTRKAKVDIFDLDYMLFPINVGQSHWVVGVINVRERGFHCLDSLNNDVVSPNFVSFLRKYIADEHKDKKGTPLCDAEHWDFLPIVVPQQHNGFDCGVFTCFFAEYFSAEKVFDFSQDDMPLLRLRLTARLVKAEELWPEP